jgi:uncharacterized protein with FMN-binding domain
MRRIVLWFMTTLSAVVLLLGYRTSTSSALPAGTASRPAAGTSTGTAANGTATPGANTAGGTVVTGAVASTRWGPVQVQLTVAGGKITAAQVVQQPDGNGRDQEINASAVPTLVQETLDAQSAKIDMVSGATVTSEGYLQSLQSALDQAHLA